MEKIILAALADGEKDSGVQIFQKQIGDQGILFLSQQNTISIKALRLQLNQITFAGMVHFSRAQWNSLRELVLSWNPIGTKGCKWLTRAKLNNISQLWLNDINMDRAGLIHLCKGRWPQLQQIGLNSNILVDNLGRITKLNSHSLKEIYVYFIQENTVLGEMMSLLIGEWRQLERIYLEQCQNYEFFMSLMAKKRINQQQLINKQTKYVDTVIAQIFPL